MQDTIGCAVVRELVLLRRRRCCGFDTTRWGVAVLGAPIVAASSLTVVVVVAVVLTVVATVSLDVPGWCASRLEISPLGNIDLCNKQNGLCHANGKKDAQILASVRCTTCTSALVSVLLVICTRRTKHCNYFMSFASFPASHSWKYPQTVLT